MYTINIGSFNKLQSTILLFILNYYKGCVYVTFPIILWFKTNCFLWIKCNSKFNWAYDWCDLGSAFTKLLKFMLALKLSDYLDQWSTNFQLRTLISWLCLPQAQCQEGMLWAPAEAYGGLSAMSAMNVRMGRLAPYVFASQTYINKHLKIKSMYYWPCYWPEWMLLFLSFFFLFLKMWTIF